MSTVVSFRPALFLLGMSFSPSASALHSPDVSGDSICLCVHDIHGVPDSGSSDSGDPRGTLGWQRAGVRGPSSSSHCHFFFLFCLLPGAYLFPTNFNLLLTKSLVSLTINISVRTSHLLELMLSPACSRTHVVCLLSYRGQLSSAWPLGNPAGAALTMDSL